jgi:hypothetical protein
MFGYEKENAKIMIYFNYTNRGVGKFGKSLVNF